MKYSEIEEKLCNTSVDIVSLKKSAYIKKGHTINDLSTIIHIRHAQG